MNTLNAIVLSTSVLFSATANAALKEELTPLKVATPEFTLSGENFIEGNYIQANSVKTPLLRTPIQSTVGFISNSNSTLNNDLSLLEKGTMHDFGYDLLSSEANAQTSTSGTTFTAPTLPNTFGMLLAGAGMIGFMVATRRKY